MRALSLAFLAALFATAPAAHAAAPAPPRVVVVTIDGTRLGDWIDPSLPAIDGALRRSAIGLLSTRTATRTQTLDAAAVEGYRAFGSGTFSDAGDPKTLIRTLRRAGIVSSVVARSGAASALSPDVVRLVSVDAEVRAATRTALSSSQLVIVQLDRRMAPTDRFLDWLGAQLTSDDRLILTSVAPPQERIVRSRFLTAVAMTGASGLLTSETTRRDGVVTLADIAPTILHAFDVAIPPSMSGHAMRAKPDASPLRSALDLDRAFIHAAAVRKPLLKTTVFTLSGFVVIGALLAARPLRRWAGTLSAVVLALPLALFLEPLYRASSLAATIAIVLGVALAAGVLVERVAGARAVEFLSAATMLAILGDVVMGGGLAGRSPLSYSIAEGARFHGMGNDAMGLVIVTAIVLATLRLDREKTSRPDLPVVAFFVVAAALMAGPGLGSKFGAVPAAVPAFGLVALYALRSRLRVESILVIVVLTVAAVGLVVAADLVRSGSHVSNAFGSQAGEIIARKARAAGRLFAFSYWIVGIAVCGGAVAVTIRRRSSRARTLLEKRPAVRRGLVACAAGAVAAMLTNDAGVTAAFWITALAAALLITTIGSPTRASDDLDQPAMAQGERR